MNFSKIKAIKIKNFRCLEELTIRFDNSPIVALVAGNDSGKSSAVKAVQAAIYNDEKDIKSYIRTGTKGFQIDIIFEDNIKITRTKTAANNTYTLYNADGSIKNTWDRMTQDIPDEIKAIFGVKIEDATGELLNLRTCESLLLFSLTKTTDNYKMVHSCISSELIEMTYIIGNGRIKEIERTINKSETLRDEMYAQANKIVVYTDDTINKLTNSHTDINQMLRMESAIFNTCMAKATVSELQQAIDATDPVKLQELINSKFTEDEMNTLVQLEDLYNSAAKLRQIKSELNTEKVEHLVSEKISDTEIENLQQLAEANRLNAAIQAKQAQTVDENKLNEAVELNAQLIIISQQVNDLVNMLALLHNISLKKQNSEELTRQLQEKIDELKATGAVRFDKEQNALITTCNNCNEEVLFSLNDLQLIE